jgi:hypothetical protein
MKITINFNKEKLELSLEKDTTVREVLKYLRKEFKVDENAKLTLCSNLKFYDKNDKLVKNKKEEFLLISSNFENNKKTEAEDTIENLIMKVTDADKPLKPNRQEKPGFRRMFPSFLSSSSNLYNSFDLLRRIFVNADEHRNDQDDNSEDQAEDYNNIILYRPPQLDETSVANLVEMGFPEGRARNALRLAHGNQEQATDYLLNSDERLDDEEEEVGRVALNNRRQTMARGNVLSFLTRRRNAEVNLEGSFCVNFRYIWTARGETATDI